MGPTASNPQPGTGQAGAEAGWGPASLPASAAGIRGPGAQDPGRSWSSALKYKPGLVSAENKGKQPKAHFLVCKYSVFLLEAIILWIKMAEGEQVIGPNTAC